jgi:hypothetical protein
MEGLGLSSTDIFGSILAATTCKMLGEYDDNVPRGDNIDTAQEEDRPFDDPPLPCCARGVPQTGPSQVGTLKPRSCIYAVLNPNQLTRTTNPNH